MNLQTSEEQLLARKSRTKDIMSENLDSLWDVQADLDYFQDYCFSDEDLKEASNLVLQAIFKIKNFMEKP